MAGVQSSEIRIQDQQDTVRALQLDAEAARLDADGAASRAKATKLRADDTAIRADMEGRLLDRLLREGHRGHTPIFSAEAHMALRWQEPSPHQHHTTTLPHHHTTAPFNMPRKGNIYQLRGSGAILDVHLSSDIDDGVEDYSDAQSKVILARELEDELNDPDDGDMFIMRENRLQAAQTQWVRTLTEKFRHAGRVEAESM
jgi:hypothetical protein